MTRINEGELRFYDNGMMACCTIKLNLRPPPRSIKKVK